MPVGVERDRALVTALALTPNLASWLRPRFLSSSNFVLSAGRSRAGTGAGGRDSGAFILPQTLNNLRINELGASVDFARGLRLVAGDSSLLGKAMARVRPVDMSTRLTRTSTYDLTAFDPSLKYQLALGGLESFLQQDGRRRAGASPTRAPPPSPAAPTCRYGVTFTLSHALTRTTRFQRVGEGFVRDGDHAARVAGRERALEPDLPAGRSRCSASAPRSAGARAARCRPTWTAPPALTSIESSSVTPDLQFGSATASR